MRNKVLTFVELALLLTLRASAVSQIPAAQKNLQLQTIFLQNAASPRVISENISVADCQKARTGTKIEKLYSAQQIALGQSSTPKNTSPPQSPTPLIVHLLDHSARDCNEGTIAQPGSATPLFRESSSLTPAFHDKLDRMMSALKDMGINVKVVSTTRSRTQQDKLYAKGRTIRGRTVTGRPGGYDWHEYGVAADLVPTKNGLPIWSPPVSTWNTIASVARSVGLVMGADIPPPTTAEIPEELKNTKRSHIGHDYPHVQLAGLPQYPPNDGQLRPEPMVVTQLLGGDRPHRHGRARNPTLMSSLR